MPNWCWNNLTIEGDKESIRKFRKTLNTPDKTELLCKSEDKENLRKEYLEQEKDKQNHLDNILTFVESKTKDINEFIMNDYRIKSGLDIKVIHNGDVVSFIRNRMLNLFHPVPTELLGTTSPSRESNADLIAKYGVDNCEDEGVFEDKCWDWNGDCGECETDYTEEGHCKCEDDNGKKLVWGEEVDSEEEDNPCAV